MLRRDGARDGLMKKTRRREDDAFFSRQDEDFSVLPQPRSLFPVERAAPAFDVARGRIYVGAADGILRVFSLAGRELATYGLAGPVGATPAVDPVSGEVYVSTQAGDLYAFAKDGSQLWIKRNALINDTELYFDAERIFIAGVSGNYAAFSRADGAELWTSESGDSVDAEFQTVGRPGLIPVGQQVIGVSSGGMVTAFDPKTGAQMWTMDTSFDVDEDYLSAARFYDVNTRPILHQGRIYIASISAGLYALDPEDGTVLERDESLKDINGLNQFGDFLIVTSGSQGVYMYEPNAQKTIWRYQTKQGAATGLTISRETVFFGESHGGLIALDARTGHEIGRLHTRRGFSAAPVVYEGVGSALSNSGVLYLFTAR